MHHLSGFPRLLHLLLSTSDLGPVAAGGSLVAQLSSISGLLPITPSTNYYFVAWVDVGGTWYHGDILTATTLTESETLTFDSAGGSAVASITQNYGTAVTAPANPTYPGYTFAGWLPTVPTTMPLSETLTAQWTAESETHYLEN